MSAENELELGVVMEEMIKSFIEASKKLTIAMQDDAWTDRRFVYHMPKMTMQMQLELSYSDKKIKGIFRNRSSDKRSVMVNTIGIDVVAVPYDGG